MGVTVAAMLPSLVSGASSSAGFFSLINQFQMYMLLPLLGAFIHDSVISFFTGMDFALFKLNFIPFKKIWGLGRLMNYLSIEQDDKYFNEIGFESKSSFVNNIQII